MICYVRITVGISLKYVEYIFIMSIQKIYDIYLCNLYYKENQNKNMYVRRNVGTERAVSEM